MGPELLLAFVIATVAMRAGKNGVLDVMHARRGTTPPHHQRAMKRLDLYRGLTSRTGRGQAGTGGSAGTGQVRSGQRSRAARAYLSALWADSWADARDSHEWNRAKRIDRKMSGQVRPGAARSYLAGLLRTGWDAWDRAFDRAADRHQARRSGPAGQVRPDPGTDPAPDPRSGPDPDLGTDPTPVPGTDPRPDLRLVPGTGTGTDPDPDLGTDLGTDPRTGPGTGAATDVPTAPAAGKITQEERPATMAGEITGLRSAIDWAREMEARCNEAGNGGEQAQAALANGGVGGKTAGLITSGGEYMRMAAASYGEAATELETHLKVKEAHEAVGWEAGDKEFLAAE